MTIENLEEYQDPIQYDKEHVAYDEDISYLTKSADKATGPIVDLACGTGRATIPLAKAGNSIVGVDLHRGMLRRAREKAVAEKLDIGFIEQDCTKLELGLKSDFIFMVGNSFQHFLTNEAQDKLLESIQRHLVKGGRFLFNTRFPGEEELVSTNDEEPGFSYKDGKLSVHVSYISEYDALNQVQHNITIRRFFDANGKLQDEKRSVIDLRFVFPLEMERLLEKHGFTIEGVYQDWNESPLTSNASKMVYLCKKIN
ncbi:Cypemycin methyltransferase [Oceanobacillus picturae]|uniref:Cypemycin methyltransferase n=1 Tax=Oceanobacillus picturae TaxID=171693 RepID=W9AH61_9BACI|nr:class I SAM-dependent methyltransferase [Oceanobacillus picturae]CDO04818.1 Cypemycin methyltransferase [Oceanobacillus picturae]